MSDLRERALAALSGACWPDNEAREETIKRVVAFVEAEIAAENEACAKVVADHTISYGVPTTLRKRLDGDIHGVEYAAAIRARRENANG